MDPSFADNWDIQSIGNLLIIKKPEMTLEDSEITLEENSSERSKGINSSVSKYYFLRKSEIASIATHIIRLTRGRRDTFVYKIFLSHQPAITTRSGLEWNFKVKANFERVLLLLLSIINNNPGDLNKLLTVFPITNPRVAATAAAPADGYEADGEGGIGAAARPPTAAESAAAHPLSGLESVRKRISALASRATAASRATPLEPVLPLIEPVVPKKNGGLFTTGVFRIDPKFAIDPKMKGKKGGGGRTRRVRR